MYYRWDPAYPGTVRRPGPYDRSGLRVSDAERSEVAERLSRHFADGRLDQDEFKTRLDRAMGAVTRGDLDGLFDDLPGLADDPVPRRPRRGLLLPVVIVVMLAGMTASAAAWTIHASWLLVAVAALFLWHRAGRRRRRTHHQPELHRW